MLGVTRAPFLIMSYNSLGEVRSGVPSVPAAHLGNARDGETGSGTRCARTALKFGGSLVRFLSLAIPGQQVIYDFQKRAA